MAYEEMNAWTRKDEESSPGSWRRGWASAGALIATITLIALVVMVTLSSLARDDALAWERHTYDVMLLTRTFDATMSRAEAALGRLEVTQGRPGAHAPGLLAGPKRGASHACARHTGRARWDPARDRRLARSSQRS